MLRGLDPVKYLFDVALLDGKIVAVTDSGFKEHPDGVGELFNARVAKSGQLVEVMFFSSVFN